MADFNIFSHLNNMGFGQGKQAAGQDATNEKSTIDALFDESGKPLYSAAKMIGLPFDLTSLGQTGINKPFEYEGFSGKMLMSSIIPDAQGGFLARLLHSIFLKNREITDHTQYINADGGFAGSGGGGGGGDFASGSSDFGGGGFADYNTANFGSFVNPPDFPNYAFSSVSMADLGNFTPLPVGTGQAASIELG